MQLLQKPPRPRRVSLIPRTIFHSTSIPTIIGTLTPPKKETFPSFVCLHNFLGSRQGMPACPSVIKSTLGQPPHVQPLSTSTSQPAGQRVENKQPKMKGNCLPRAHRCHWRTPCWSRAGHHITTIAVVLLYECLIRSQENILQRKKAISNRFACFHRLDELFPRAPKKEIWPVTT